MDVCNCSLIQKKSGTEIFSMPDFFIKSQILKISLQLLLAWSLHLHLKLHHFFRSEHSPSAWHNATAGKTSIINAVKFAHLITKMFKDASHNSIFTAMQFKFCIMLGFALDIGCTINFYVTINKVQPICE